MKSPAPPKGHPHTKDSTPDDPSNPPPQLRPGLLESQPQLPAPITWRKSLLIIHLLITTISILTLLIGTYGWITVHQPGFPTKNHIGFCVGIAVQIALL